VDEPEEARKFISARFQELESFLEEGQAVK